MKKITTIFLFLFLSFAVSAQNFEWQWQNPKPQGDDLNDVIVPATGEVIAVGKAGVCMKSNDGGETWTVKHIDSPTNREIKAITFINATTGFVCGTDGLVMKTEDAGDSWSPVDPGGVTESFYDLEFFDADTGYVVGAHGAIVKTTDGGANWNLSTAGGTNYSVEIRDASTIFVGSSSSTLGRLLVSKDYGTTWTNVTDSASGLGSSVYAIRFLDANVGYLISIGLWKTTNGGDNWVPKSTGLDGILYDVKCYDANTVYTLGQRGIVFKSTDAGESWNGTTVTTEYLRSISFDGSNLIVSGDNGTIAKSTDDGANYTDKFEFVTQELLREVEFIDANTGYACGGSTTTADSLGFLLKTTDGGVTWNMMPKNFTFQAYSFTMPSPTVWYVGTGNNKIFKTTDAGSTWDEQTEPISGTTHDFYEIAFTDIDNGYAVGASGHIIKTTDGGANWSELTSPFGTSTIYDMKMFSPSKVIAIGASAKAYMTIDGGTNWDPLDLGIAGTYFSLKFLNDAFGIASSYSSPSPSLSVTKDSGKTWTPMSLPSEFDAFASIWGIGIKDTNTIWVSDVNGHIGYTTDGGTSWNIAKSVTANGLYEISIVGDNMWMAGAGGAIIKGYSNPTVPVELTSFSANIFDGKVSLSWQTSTEKNNYGFEIERMQNNSSWQKIGFVKGNGTTTNSQSYSFIDKSVDNGMFSYRLKQIDFDGTYEYSKVVEVNFNVPGAFSLAQNYPNPFNPTTMIKYNLPEKANVELKVYDLTGQEVMTLVNQFQEAGQHFLNFNAAGLSSGVYFYRIKAGEFFAQKKMIVLK